MHFTPEKNRKSCLKNHARKKADRPGECLLSLFFGLFILSKLVIQGKKDIIQTHAESEYLMNSLLKQTGTQIAGM